MMALMSIAAEWEAVWAMLEESKGELTEEIENYLNTIEARSIGKIFEIQDLRENAQMAITAIKAKVDELTDKIKRIERAESNLKKMQVFVMQAANQKSLTNGVYKITLTQNPLRIEVKDEDMIPSTYKTVDVKIQMADLAAVEAVAEVRSTKVAVDKKAIGELYKASEIEIAGVEYVREANVRVS